MSSLFNILWERAVMNERLLYKRNIRKGTHNAPIWPIDKNCYKKTENVSVRETQKKREKDLFSLVVSWTNVYSFKLFTCIDVVVWALHLSWTSFSFPCLMWLWLCVRDMQKENLFSACLCLFHFFTFNF